MWESQAQMEHITGKLVNPQDYRPKAVIEKEKEDQAKKMKAKIRDELLGSQSFADVDFRLYSDTLAGKAQESKSEIQKKEEAKKAVEDKKQKQKDDIQKLQAI